ncbi:MAG: glycosyl hydrolase family 25 [Bacteroidales bacterium]|nr:glycosyl hydrolase family 25 [Bacteroidales bacterium]
MKPIVVFILSVILVSCNAGESHKRIDNTKSISRGYAGIDVSWHQGSIDWVKASKDFPVDCFVYIKCTEGASYQDKNFKTYAKGAKKQGLHIGGYHYFRMTSSAHEQFKNYKNALDVIDGDLIPMVDVETSDKRPKKDLQDSLQVFLKLLEKEYGKMPMIYGTMRSYNTYCAPKFNSYPLYIGRYGKKAPIVNGPSHYTIWQYSETGTIRGIEKPVDLCSFHKSKSITDILL